MVLLPLIFALVLSFSDATTFRYGPSYVLTSTIVIPDEAVTFNRQQFLDAKLGKCLLNFSTPYGMWAQYYIVNMDDPANSTSYMFYYVNNSEVCYSYSTSMPYPVPQSSLGEQEYVKDGVYNGQPVSVYRTSHVGRYQVRLLTDAVPDQPKNEFVAVIFNSEGSSHVEAQRIMNGSTTPSSVFDLPSACKASSVRKLKHHVPFTNLANHQIPGSVKFNALPETKGEAFWDVIKSAGPAPWLHKYTPRIKNGDLPASIDNRVYASPVRNQDLCGGCWAFSSAAATELVFNVKHNVTFPYTLQWLSVQNIIDCATGADNGTAPFPSKGCFGGWPMVALHHIIESGLMYEVNYTYDSANGYKCRQDTTNSIKPLVAAAYIPPPPTGQSPATVNTPIIMSAVAEHGAVIAIINVPLSFVFYQGGYIYNDPACTPGLNHAVVIVGWGTEGSTDYWIIKNSFGAAWGEAGYVRMAKGINMCGIEDLAFVPQA